MGIEIFGIMLIILFAALLVVGVILLLITRNPNNAGARCSGNGDCTGGSICEMSSHTCRIPDGGTCDTNAQCSTGSACASNVCIRVTPTSQIDITDINLTTATTSIRGRATPTRSIKSIVDTEVAKSPPRVIKLGRNTGSDTDQVISPFSLDSDGTVFESERNVDILKGSHLLERSPKVKFSEMVHGAELVCARKKWRADPIPEKPNTWKSKPVPIVKRKIEPENVEVSTRGPVSVRYEENIQEISPSRWKVKPVVQENTWKAVPLTGDKDMNLLDLDFYSSTNVPNSVPLEPMSWKALPQTENVEFLTQTSKLRSQFVEEKPAPHIEESHVETTQAETFSLKHESTKKEWHAPRAVSTKSKKMEIVGNSGKLEVPIQYDYEEEEEYPYGTFRDSSVRGVTVSSEGRHVLDLCHFSSYIIYLHEGGYATRETISKDNVETEKLSVKMNIKPTLLAKHRGNLYALQNQNLYSLDISTLTSTSWKWSSCDWSPLSIINMSATTDGKHLYLQTLEYDILYDSSLNEVSRIPSQHKRRVYGYDLQTYIDIDSNTSSAIYYLGNKQEMMFNIVDAVILHTGKVVPINIEESSLYSRIRLIQWRPWYVKKILL